MDVLFVNATVLCPGPAPAGTAVGVSAGRICRVGDEGALRAEAGARTRIVDLREQALLPGFEDSHAHLWKIGALLTSTLDLRSASSFADLGRFLQEGDRELPRGSWLLGRGLNEAALAERRRPDRHVLDAFVSDRPVALTRACGHILAVNSAALGAAGITAGTADPSGGQIERDAHGAPTGLLTETAMGLIQRVLPAPSAADYEAMITAALRHQLSRGVTSSSDCGVLPEVLAVYLEMDRRGVLPARVNVMPLAVPDGASQPYRLDLPPRYRTSMLCVDTVKFLADGGLSGATAALSIPYKGSSSTGVLRFETDNLRSLFRAAEDAGWRIATHAIGDRAIAQVTELYEDLGAGSGHRVEHLGLPHTEHLARLARAGSMVSTQPAFLYELGANFDAVVPEQLTGRIYPFREMIDAGLVTAFSSDAPVVADDSPLRAIASAVSRRSREGYLLLPEQAVTTAEALHACTTAGATLAGAAKERGSIREGLLADLVVLSGDPTRVSVPEITNLRVEQTWLAGELVYQREGFDEGE